MNSPKSRYRVRAVAHTIGDLTTFAERLDEAGISYQLMIYRADAVSFFIAVPGERWEVDYLSDGTVDVEVFKSDDTDLDAAKLDDLFARYSD